MASTENRKADTMRIERIISVTDTREYEERGDKWYPIAGSGESHECSKCGRLHEVHASVELEDGLVVVVGTGCMKSESAKIVKAAKRGASRAKRIASLKAEIRALEALDARRQEIDRAVEALPAPAVTVRESGADDYADFAFTAGDATVYGYRKDSEREEAAIRAWRANRAEEMGLTRKMESASTYLNAARDALERCNA